MAIWGLYKDRGRWVIRQGPKRLPVSKYKAFRDNEELLRQYVHRLNAPSQTQEKVSFKHAFINEALLDSYLEYLLTQVPTAKNARCEFHFLKSYGLNFFIGKLDLMNPTDWHLVSETKWANYLQSDEVPKAAHTKRLIVRALNRFMGWLHKRRPGEVSPLKFTPISKATFKQIEAQRALDGDITERRLISEADWINIKSHLPPDIAPFVHLGMNYGLRRSETLGCIPGSVWKSHLRVDRQYLGGNEFSPTKGRSERKIPHWFATAAEAYLWIEAAQSLRMHPDTLSDRWKAYLDTLKMDYDFHDLRHTFITKAIRLHPSRDVQLAAGHVNIQTTMGYLHDDRDLGDEPYKPGA